MPLRMFGGFVAMKWLIDYAIEKHGSSYKDESMSNGKSNVLLENPLYIVVTHVSWVSVKELLPFMEILENLRGSPFWTLGNFAGETPLHRLAASGPTQFPANTYIIENFLSYERQFDCLWKYLDGLFDMHNGMNILHAAYHLGHAYIAKVLLEAGVNPNATTTGA
ncbi:hypothetical protein F5B22DRAFT_654243 [Xylaria bambusicola]|uniref:uncharacterized protein n=1 Tax=Xylaria bambusicola TaxID=326684 RepID=UPI0020079140|nr:uncharacterized protein F5B22DRAFT_654243 [Xylaria bambusicola]KAI0517903.1 hypothetical protein F5B22DRAFT_654243 [Xylaria bambusicola]